ncbi:hypothetical protein [Leucobacter sp. cx-169]|uniref:hypothetical protein n=1 Tax=Leucobacter sp. cx-169 TaxID=2770549 RepID=UPI00165D8CF3|nr:hypothetical protein [Leucobacter sp. cx-169]MBC9927243.1 hypothetical protein [Leucobacter sp. cx-169]
MEPDDWDALPDSQRQLVRDAIEAERESLVSAIRDAQSPEVAETRQRELAQIDALSADIHRKE